jgi:outer membrane protein assembly factor BamA
VRKQRSVFILCLVCGFLFACNSTRHIRDGDYLLVKNKVIPDSSLLPVDKFDYYIKQKPNRKILGLFRFHLWVYNLGMAGDTSVHPKRKRWLRRIGEEPVVFDTTLTDLTRSQFKLFLNKNGFFNSNVTDSLRPRKKKMKVEYFVRYEESYKIKSISYATQDSGISSLINYYQQNSLIIPGERYDEEVMEKERDRITNDLRDRGYYFFNRNFITIQIDTALGTHQAEVYLYINRINENVANNNEEIYPILNHSIYHLRNIFIQTDFNIRNPNSNVPLDTTMYNGYYILSAGKYRMLRDNVLTRNVFVKTGDTYLPRDVEFTYNRLQQLNVFKYINLVFKEVDNGGLSRELDLFIQLSPAQKLDFTFETEMTNTGGNLGVAGSAGYRDKNLLRGAEVLEIKLKGGLEAIPDFNDDATKSFYFFNTYEIGPELTFSLKRLPWQTSRFSNPKTNFTVGYNYENRPDYVRSITNFAISYNWSPTKRQRFLFYFPDINQVKVNLSNAFAAELDDLNDPRLSYTYESHLITSTHLTWIYTDQKQNEAKNFIYFRTTGELAVKAFPSAINPSQFAKINFDFSYHHFVNRYNNLVFRIATGYGKPYGSSTALPFEKSFFAGGANSIRAWNTGTLGPGSYNGGLTIEQSGDIEIETNLEYRSEIFRFPNNVIMELATFIDAGNIWTSFEDASRPGAKFETENIIREFGVGAGAGVRFNFSFFLFRLDGAVKLRNPAYPETQRWVYPNHSFQMKDITINFAIGYPF